MRGGASESLNRTTILPSRNRRAKFVGAELVGTFAKYLAKSATTRIIFPSHATRERQRTHYSRPGSPVFTFRPAYIYPVEARKEPNFSYRLLRAIYPFFRLVFPNQVIRADDWPERWLIFRTDHIAGKRLGKNVAESIMDTILLPR